MVYNQVKKSPVIKKIIIATSSSKSDNSVEVFAKKNFEFYRGSQKNVASRFYDLIKKNNYKYFVRISGDSPLLDFRLINKMYKFCYLNRYDLITNLKPRTYPKRSVD